MLFIIVSINVVTERISGIQHTGFGIRFTLIRISCAEIGSADGVTGIGIIRGRVPKIKPCSIRRDGNEIILYLAILHIACIGCHAVLAVAEPGVSLPRSCPCGHAE